MAVQRTRLSDQVADQLRAMITDRVYRPGEKLPVEAELAAHQIKGEDTAPALESPEEEPLD